ncbi:ABC transporter substrate-binding protein [Formosa algae]|uniref:Iron complex transport system substrate-binding protein n=1 Tax=Formosa algae TaxID=225843 RepID=A0A9X1CBZ8_9FLAO|nr:ABC transporter substrate-binding protein [Formosa algae]MBP1839735.1 iron complex transport system substrate-binding protein [Formosa algae]MDQ0335334.1 iron complex transport system substrate-binding protein [Formosa algae]OEI79271.1 ABC transporter substrate-binding protein [Formosa algae]
MKNLQLKSLCLVFFVMVLSCKNETKTQQEVAVKSVALSLKHAKGFSVKTFENYKVLEIYSPWPNADQTYTYALVDKTKSENVSLNSEDFDAIIPVPIERIVVTSTTHLPGLELLGQEKKLIGFPGTQYVSSEKIRARIDNKEIRELGKNEGVNTEVLLELHPEVVIAFGIDGNNNTMETIRKANIPVIYNGDWVEDSPLAKAEWIKFFGVLFQEEHQAEVVYNKIETAYLEAKTLAEQVEQKPSVFSGAMYKDVWYMPNGTSSEAQLLKDANANYLWKNTKGAGSLALNFETVFNKAKAANIWINPSIYGSYKALESANTHYTKFDAYKQKQVYSMSNTKGATGGVLYYELGQARPDLVLKDLIKICHPELLQDYDLFFFKKLN